MTWDETNLRTLAIGLAIGGKWNHVNGKETVQPPNETTTCEFGVMNILYDQPMVFGGFESLTVEFETKTDL